MSEIHQVEKRPSVSVLLPAWNEAETLSRCLDAFVAIDWPELEVIVCAGGSDDTAVITRRYAEQHTGRIVCLKQAKGEGKQAALRRCYEHSWGEVIYLTDADCVVPPETLTCLVAAVGPDGVDAATGPTDPFPDQRRLSWVRHQWAGTRAVDRERPCESTGILGRNCAVRREAVEAAGAFREPVKIGTDYHFAKMLLAAGGEIRFVSAPVQTRYAEGFREYLGQQSRWIRNILIHGPRFGDQAEIAGVTRTMALGSALLAWPLTWRWTKWLGIGLWLMPLGWMTRVRMKQQRMLEGEAGLPRETGPVLLVRSALYSVADLIVWARPIIDFMNPRQRLRW